MSEAVDILMRLKGGRTAASEARNVGRAIGDIGTKSRRSGEQAHKAGKSYEYATQRLRLFGHAAVGVRERSLGLASAALGLSAGIFGLEHVVRTSVEAWGEQRRTLAQTSAALKSTGGAAGVTAGHIERLAEAISRQTGIEGNQIVQAENMLLTFRDVRNEAGKGNDIFNQSTRAVVDMQAAFQSAGKSMTLGDSALQLGKALNDPAKGMTRLQRIGVAFTAQQQQQIKTFTAFGDRVNAQKIIIRELNKEFGGSAAAVATPGMKLRATIKQLEESFGRGLQPAIDAVDRNLLHLADRALPSVRKAADDVGKIFNRKDLTTGQKLGLAFRVTRRDMAPLFRDIRREVKNWHVEKRIQDAISWAAPIIAQSAAHAVPKIIGAFWNAFRKSDVWGKIAILGFITWKFGVIRSIGGSVASALAGGIAKRLAATEAGTAIATSLGTGVRSTAALTVLSGIGSTIGRVIGAAAGIGIASAIAQAIGAENADPLLFLHPPATGGHKRKDGTYQDTIPKHLAKSPLDKNFKAALDYDRRLLAAGKLTVADAATMSARERKALGIALAPNGAGGMGIIRTGHGDSRKPKRRPQHGRHTQGFRLDSPHPSLHGVLTIHNHHHLYVDGKEMTAVIAPNLAKGNNPRWVSAAIGKDTADRKARR